MPQIGWFEILIIVIISIIIIGPKDFPIVIKKIGSWIGSVKRYVRNIQNEVSELGKEALDTEIKDSDISSKKKEKNDKSS